MIRNVVRDVAVAARMILRRPKFAAIAVVTLAVGIGASTAVFSVVRALLLRSLPYRDAGRLAFIEGAGAENAGGERLASFDELRQWRTQGGAFETLFAVSPLWNFVLTGASDPEQVKGQFVSPDFFSALGAAPAIGRGFLAEEHRTAAPVVVISDGLWRRRFGADPGILGRRLAVDGEPATIVGVAAPGFEFLEPADVWTPLERNPFSHSRGYVRMLSVAGRARNRRGAARLRRRRRSSASPPRRSRSPSRSSGRPRSLPGRIAARRELVASAASRPRATAFLLAFFAALALLLTTVGVYGVLAYAVRTRTAEIGVRMALGARAADIRRMVLASGLRLAAWGMGAGLLAAAAATRLMRAILFGITPGDAPSYAAAAVLLLGAAMLAAWVPARRATRVDPMTALRNE